jgi:hypothetical protein
MWLQIKHFHPFLFRGASGFLTRRFGLPYLVLRQRFLGTSKSFRQPSGSLPRSYGRPEATADQHFTPFYGIQAGSGYAKLRAPVTRIYGARGRLYAQLRAFRYAELRVPGAALTEDSRNGAGLRADRLTVGRTGPNFRPHRAGWRLNTKFRGDQPKSLASFG